MIEIALCLAIIGFALVAIIGVLPIGMSTQKENREDTIINFEANYLMDAIRSGSRGLDMLTNYVVDITNIATVCDSNGVPGKVYVNSYSYSNFYSGSPVSMSLLRSTGTLTNGQIIMALLTTPKYIPTLDGKGGYFSNYVTADFRPITGSPLDQGVGPSSKDFAFTYRVMVENVPSAAYPFFSTNDLQDINFSAPPSLLTNAPDLNTSNLWGVAKNLQANMHELRLRFRWPVLPGGKLGNGDRVFRTSVSGTYAFVNFPWLPATVPLEGGYYLFQSQTYTNAP